MPGFDCPFVEAPPKYLQFSCPICLLIVREPYQVSCCGKNFCKLCIEEIKSEGKPCPTCRESLKTFQNKGLKQSLYGIKVFCSNNPKGCSWQGELGMYDQHRNAKFTSDNWESGCPFLKIYCSYCKMAYPRKCLHDHMKSECLKRPFTCTMCKEYKSTFEDATIKHAPKCKCRPVECPNSCGTSHLQHQHLEEHKSSRCPLTLVECEFSDAGCNAKVYRKDLPSHLKGSAINHMSLMAKNGMLKKNCRSEMLAEKKKLQDEVEKVKKSAEKHQNELQAENKRLQSKIEELKKSSEKQHNDMQAEKKKLLNKIEELKSEVKLRGEWQVEVNKKFHYSVEEHTREIKELKSQNVRLHHQLEQRLFKMLQVPPIDFLLENFSSLQNYKAGYTFPLSFYSKPGGCCLQLTVQIIPDLAHLQISYAIVKGEFTLSCDCNFHITTLVVDQVYDHKPHSLISVVTSQMQVPNHAFMSCDETKNFVKNNTLLFRVAKIEFL